MVRHWPGRVSLAPVSDQMTIPWQTTTITACPGSPLMAVRSAARHRARNCESGSQERVVPSGHSPLWASKSSTAARTSSADRQLNVSSGQPFAQVELHAQRQPQSYGDDRRCLQGARHR